MRFMPKPGPSLARLGELAIAKPSQNALYNA
jgi:hypothetical protein